MGRKLKDLTGLRFDKLTVISRAEDHVEPSGRRKVTWLCKCDCGNTIIVTGDNLNRGYTTSCGCNRGNNYNGLSIQYPRIYYIWKHMKDRCFNSKCTNYKNYGGRGITICEEWYDFNNFVEWALNNGYTEELTIDRIDVNGNYEPNNCRWSDRKEQNNNRRNNHLLTYKGITLTVMLMAEKYNIPYQTLLQRIIKLGWSIEKAIETPVRKRK